MDLLHAINDELSERNTVASSEDKPTMEETPIQEPERVDAPVKTEDLGKIFEMGICLLYDTPYDGKYKYSMAEAEAFRDRLKPLKELFPLNCYHTAKGGSLYDFTAYGDESLHLSAKTTKGDCKIAPQYIGQATPATFCERLGLPKMSDLDLKQYLQENITDILPRLEEYTFSCPIIYYNKKKDVVQYITKEGPIPWSSLSYSWTKPWDKWSNSSTLCIQTPTKKISLLEIQFHTKRSNMAIRWCFEKLLTQFPIILRCAKF